MKITRAEVSSKAQDWHIFLEDGSQLEGITSAKLEVGMDGLTKVTLEAWMLPKSAATRPIATPGNEFCNCRWPGTPEDGGLCSKCQRKLLGT
jgi:hypothetical protein